jgi:Flp pilus assembly protein TadG
MLTDDCGVSSVEFALVASLFFMIVFGLIDVSRVWGMHERLRAGVREGARVAAVQTDPTASIAAVRSVVEAAALPIGGSGVSDAQITLAVDTANKLVTVSVLSYSMPLITPFAGIFGHSTVSLSASSVIPWHRAP